MTLLILLTNRRRIIFSLLLSDTEFAKIISWKSNGSPFGFKDELDGEVANAIVTEAIFAGNDESTHEKITGTGNYRRYPNHELKPCSFTGTINHPLKSFSFEVFLD